MFIILIWKNKKKNNLQLFLRKIFIISKKIVKKLNKNNEVNDVKPLEFPEFMKTWYLEYKPFIIPEIKKSIPYDCEENPFKFLQPCLYMNAEFEKLNEIIKIKIQEKQNELTQENKELNTSINKLFQPLSLRSSNIPKYITIDTATLSNLFSEQGEKAKNNKNISENQIDIWSSYFRIDKKIFGFSNISKKKKKKRITIYF